jgi:3-hydroxyisobutyrate dehydrogenase-like beta-hydroxyacid dehydrogenase
MKIGVAGTGRMGTAIVRRLLERGHELHAWNRTAANAQDACEADGNGGLDGVNYPAYWIERHAASAWWHEEAQLFE